jgi:hypothetical protein
MVYHDVLDDRLGDELLDYHNLDHQHHDLYDLDDL